MAEEAAITAITENVPTFSHSELLQITSSIFKELLSKDSYLSDLPAQVTLEEINNEIALLHGKSITVYIVRGNQVMPVIVPQAVSKVHDLKRAFQRALSLKLERDCLKFEKPKKISWKYVWKTWNLQCDDTILSDDNVLLQVYNVVHKSYVSFVKRRREKSGIRRRNVTHK